jgi:hypothetical protein
LQESPQDAPPLRSGAKEEKITENDRKDLLHWQQDISLIGSRNLKIEKKLYSNSACYVNAMVQKDV